MLNKFIHLVGFIFASFASGYFLCLLENFLFEEVLEESTQILFNETALFSTSTFFTRCSVSKCLDLNRCLLDPYRRLKVASQPLYDVVDEKGVLLSSKPSREFLELRRVVKSSVYHEEDIELACLILPGIDTLSFTVGENQEYGEKAVMFSALQSVTSALPNGSNIIFFNFVDDFARLRASEKLQHRFLSAKTGFQRSSYRQSFDVSIPPIRPYNLSHFNPLSTFLSDEPREAKYRSVLVVLWDVPYAVKIQYLQTFGSQKLLNNELGIELNVTFLVDCNDSPLPSGSMLSFQRICAEEIDKSNYLALLKRFDFLIVSDHTADFEFILLDVLEVGEALVVIISDDHVLPFHEIVDWSTFSLTFTQILVPEIPKILLQIPPDILQAFRARGKVVYNKYFSSLEQITLTTFSILESRIIPGAATKRGIEDNKEGNCGVEKLALYPPANPSPLDKIVTVILLRELQEKDALSAKKFLNHITTLLTSIVQAMGSKLNQIFIIRKMKDGSGNGLENIDIHKAFTSVDVHVVEFVDMKEVPQILAIIKNYTGYENAMAMIDGDAAAQFTEKEFTALKGCLKKWSDKPHTTAIFEAGKSDLSSTNKVKFPATLISSSYHKELLDIFAAQVWSTEENVCMLQELLATSPKRLC